MLVNICRTRNRPLQIKQTYKSITALNISLSCITCFLKKHTRQTIYQFKRYVYSLFKITLKLNLNLRVIFYD